MRKYYILDDNNYIKMTSNVPFYEGCPYLENVNIKHGLTRIINGIVDETQPSALYLKKQYRKELQQIQSWFLANDWKVNKIVIGEWETNDVRWTDYLIERSAKRQRQDELNKLLNEV